MPSHSRSDRRPDRNPDRHLDRSSRSSSPSPSPAAVDAAPRIQAKLEVGTINDPFEQEADQAAQRVTRWLRSSAAPADGGEPTARPSTPAPFIQRRAERIGASAPVSPAVESAISQARGGGQPLDSGLGRRFGQAFGTDFGGVRVHTNYQADRLNRSLQARAFTTGKDVFFRGGEYQPATPAGQELLAHELAHVVQQRPTIQRKAYLGLDGNFRGPDDLSDERVQALNNDNVVRRFNNQAELDDFAADPEHPGMGVLPDGYWVHLPDQMLVLGEHHGAPKAPDIIRATHIRRWRYEGFASYAAERLKNQKLSEHVDAREAETLNKLQLAAHDDGGDHFVESAIPKFARSIPEVIDMAAAQAAPNARASDKAGAALGDGYSMKKAALRGFVSALIFARSYPGKLFGNSIEKFNYWSKNVRALDQAIERVQAAVDGGRMPDFSGLTLVPKLDELTTAYETLAKAEVGLGNAQGLNAFKASLVLRDEPPVTRNVRAQQSDYLRDASMIATIRQAAQAGDRLFVIGDAHRHKLQRLVTSAGLPIMTDDEFLAQERQRDRQAAGLTNGIRDQAESKLPDELTWTEDGNFVLPPLTGLAGCAWGFEWAEPSGVENEYKLTYYKVKIKVVWGAHGLTERLAEREYEEPEAVKQKKKKKKKPAPEKKPESPQPDSQASGASEETPIN